MKFLVILAICGSLSSMLVYCERRIFGGRLAELGQFPYQISLRLKGKGICTGTIIHDSWVITAAHCVVQRGKPVSAEDVTILAGYVKQSLGEGRTAKASKIIVHSDYGLLTSKHDFALVKVENPFKFDDQVGKISLSDDPWPSTKGRICTIAGFGKTENDTYNELRYLQVQTRHGKNTCPCIVKNFQLKRLICLKPTKGEGACFGDSGGGMICDGKVVGIAHMVMDKRSCKYFEVPDTGFDCGSEFVYAMYMYICPGLDWIKQYVPGVPGTPESCDGCRIKPSITVLFLCVYIIIVG